MNRRTVFVVLIFLLSFVWPAIAQEGKPEDLSKVTAADLLSGKGKELVGDNVTMWYQPVQVKTGDGAIWVGPNQDEMVLVTMPLPVHVLDEDGRPVKLEEGDKVQVEGVVMEAPREYELRRGWGVNDDDMFLVEKAGVIVMARSVKFVQDAEEE